MSVNIEYNAVSAQDFGKSFDNCRELTELWIFAAAQKDKPYYQFLLEEGIAINSGVHFESLALQEKLTGDFAARYELVLAKAAIEDKPKKIVGCLLAFKENIFSAKIERMCTLKSYEQTNLTDHKIGTNLLNHYINNVIYNPIMPVENINLDSHDNAISFWENMGFERSDEPVKQGKGTQLTPMYMNEDRIEYWQNHKQPPSRPL